MQHEASNPWRAFAASLLLVLLAAAGASADAEEAPPWPDVEVIDAWPGVTFEGPVGVVTAGDGSDFLYVWERRGVVKRVAKWRGTQEVPAPTPYLDLGDRVSGGPQGGLLGLAFHPDHARNGLVYATYLRGEADGGFEWVLSEFRAQGGVADPVTERTVLAIPKSSAMHNGGWIAFGPDGTLYAGTGDDARRQEAMGTSQDPRSLLGKILRLDVDRRDGSMPYAIPEDNPWARYTGEEVRREIFAYGLRNPRQFCFDAEGRVWTAEPGVEGPGARGWVMRAARGGNLGWPFFQGTQPLEPIPESLQGQEFVRPAFEYVRGEDPDRTAAWGGVFYRGNRVPGLRGRYLFGDTPRGAIYTIDLSTGTGRDWRTLTRVPGALRMGEDAQGELYFVSPDEGRIYTLVPR